MVCDLVSYRTCLFVDFPDQGDAQSQVRELRDTAHFGDDRLGERVECDQRLVLGDVLVLCNVENGSASDVLSFLGTENSDLVTEYSDDSALDRADHVLAALGADDGVSGNLDAVGDAGCKLDALLQRELIESRSVEDVALSGEQLVAFRVFDDVAGDPCDQNRVLELDLVLLGACGCGSSDVEGSHRELRTGLTDGLGCDDTYGLTD